MLEHLVNEILVITVFLLLSKCLQGSWNNLRMNLSCIKLELKRAHTNIFIERGRAEVGSHG